MRTVLKIESASKTFSTHAASKRTDKHCCEKSGISDKWYGHTDTENHRDLATVIGYVACGIFEFVASSRSNCLINTSDGATSASDEGPLSDTKQRLLMAGTGWDRTVTA